MTSKKETAHDVAAKAMKPNFGENFMSVCAHCHSPTKRMDLTQVSAGNGKQFICEFCTRDLGGIK